jgi:hypothetical protein
MSMRMIVYVSPPGLENLPPPLTQIGGSLPPRPPTWKALNRCGYLVEYLSVLFTVLGLRCILLFSFSILPET